jgi:hypothetical protein
MIQYHRYFILTRRFAPRIFHSFQSYLRDRQFHQCRMGYMYGRVSEGEEVEVEFVYEPMQEADDTSFNLVETEEAETERENVEEVRSEAAGLFTVRHHRYSTLF